MTFPYEAVIFDMDGTLVDSEVVWEAAEHEMFKELGVNYTNDVRDQVIGMRLDAFFQKLKDIFNLTHSVDALCDDLTQRVLKLLPTQTVAKPGAIEMIKYVSDLGVPYAIASSSPMAIIEAVVLSQQWQDVIRHLYTADDVAHGKPWPDVYLHAAKTLGVDPTRCVAIEDSVNGAKAAVAAGMTCYAVPDYHTKRERFADITPLVFSSLHEVLADLQQKAVVSE
jgi:mannitol-1-/sugar-/sorbitol-6-/2-deoxyglucose-6-phosphatase